MWKPCRETTMPSMGRRTVSTSRLVKDDCWNPVRPAALSGRELGRPRPGLHWKDMAILSIVWEGPRKIHQHCPPHPPGPSRWANELGSREPAARSTDTSSWAQSPVGEAGGWGRGERGHGAHPTLPTVSSSYPLLATSLVQDHVNSVTVSLGIEKMLTGLAPVRMGKTGESV